MPPRDCIAIKLLESEGIPRQFATDPIGRTVLDVDSHSAVITTRNAGRYQQA